MSKWNVAAYLRLSSDDGDKAESNSIGNQRSIINQYIKQNKEFKNVEYYNTGDKAQNYGLIVKGLTRFVGSNTEALEANYGAVEENKNQWGNFKEAVGRNIMGIVTPDRKSTRLNSSHQ